METETRQSVPGVRISVVKAPADEQPAEPREETPQKAPDVDPTIKRFRFAFVEE